MLSSSCRRCWSRSIHVSLVLVLVLVLGLMPHHHRHHRSCMTMAMAITLIPLMWPSHHSGFLPLHLPILVQVNLERIHVVLEAQGSHGPEKIVAVDRLPLLLLALIGSLSCYEADELRHALLHRLLRLLRYLRVRRQRLLHDPAHVCYWEEPVLLPATGQLVAPARVPRVTSWLVVGLSHGYLF